MTATGETCSNSTPAVVDTLTIEFACDLSFASSGTRDVSASFADSSSHHGSSSTALSHTVTTTSMIGAFAAANSSQLFERGETAGIP